jgi:hypothetical protein
MRRYMLVLFLASCARSAVSELPPGADAGPVMNEPDGPIGNPDPPPVPDAGPLIAACINETCVEYHPPRAEPCVFPARVVDACPRPAQAICDMGYYWSYWYWKILEVPNGDGGVLIGPDGPINEGYGIMPPPGTCDAVDAGPDAITSGGPFL